MMHKDSEFYNVSQELPDQIVLKAFQLLLHAAGEKGIELPMSDFISDKLKGKCIKIDPQKEGYLKFTLVHDPRN